MSSRPSMRAQWRPLSPQSRRLFAIVLALVCFGLVMVYSATSAGAIISGGDQFGIVSRQLIFVLLGVVVCMAFARMPVSGFDAISRILLPVAVGMLLFIHVAPDSIAPIIGGARRWIVLGGIQVQPSEIAKLALIMWIATMIARQPKMVTTPRTLMPVIIATSALALLIVTEPDLGTASILVAVAFAMVFVAGAPSRMLAAAAGIGVALALLVIAMSPYQQSRIVAFLHPWEHQYDQSFQVAQAQIALGSGGTFGRGLGNSIQKNNYLPEAHTDMIGAIIGEELGFVGLAGVMVLFILIGTIGFRIARKASSPQERLLATGITAMICLQGGINLAQVTGAFPITGVPLPFVSYGGTNLLVSLAGIGILMNIANRGAHATRRAQRPTGERGDRSVRNGGTRQTGARDRGRIAS